MTHKEVTYFCTSRSCQLVTPALVSHAPPLVRWPSLKITVYYLVHFLLHLQEAKFLHGWRYLQCAIYCVWLCVSVCWPHLQNFYRNCILPHVLQWLSLLTFHWIITVVQLLEYMYIYMVSSFIYRIISTWRHHRKIHRYTVQWQSKLQQSLIASDHQLFPLSPPFIVSGLFCLPEIHHSMTFQADSTLL